MVNPIQPLEPSSPHGHLKPVDCSAHGSGAVGQHDSVIMAVVVDAKVLYEQLVNEHAKGLSYWHCRARIAWAPSTTMLRQPLSPSSSCPPSSSLAPILTSPLSGTPPLANLHALPQVELILVFSCLVSSSRNIRRLVGSVRRDQEYK